MSSMTEVGNIDHLEDRLLTLHISQVPENVSLNLSKRIRTTLSHCFPWKRII